MCRGQCVGCALGLAELLRHWKVTGTSCPHSRGQRWLGSHRQAHRHVHPKYLLRDTAHALECFIISSVLFGVLDFNLIEKGFWERFCQNLVGVLYDALCTCSHEYKNISTYTHAHIDGTSSWNSRDGLKLPLLDSWKYFGGDTNFLKRPSDTFKMIQHFLKHFTEKGIAV